MLHEYGINRGHITHILAQPLMLGLRLLPRYAYVSLGQTNRKEALKGLRKGNDRIRACYMSRMHPLR